MMKKKLFQESYNNKIILLLFIIYELITCTWNISENTCWIGGLQVTSIQNLEFESHTINAIYEL